MIRRYLRWCLLPIAILTLLMPFVTGAQTPVAGTAVKAAGVLIDRGEGDPVYLVVTWQGEPMSAIEVLRQADIPLVTVEFGGMGEGVCAIIETGCDVSACRQRLCQTGDPESPFWQYWRQSDDGDWTLSALGGGQSRVADGDIDAWVWTGTEPSLPALSWEELAAKAGAPEPIARDEISGAPAVYRSGTETPDNGDDISGETVTAIGLVMLLGIAGGWLVLRQRRVARDAS